MNELGNRYALAALKDKRATLAGEIAALKKQLAWKAEQLAHVDATIAVFDPAYDAATQKLKRPRKRVKLYRQGELSRSVIDVLRRAGKPLSTPEIVSRLMEAQGHGEDARNALTPRVRSNLQYLHRQRGTVEKVGTGRNCLWALATR